LVASLLPECANAAELTGAWAPDANQCDKVFVRRRRADFAEFPGIHGGGFIIDADQIRGKFEKCKIKTRKEEGQNLNPIAACATDSMLCNVQFVLKVVFIGPGLSPVTPMLLRRESRWSAQGTQRETSEASGLADDALLSLCGAVPVTCSSIANTVSTATRAHRERINLNRVWLDAAGDVQGAIFALLCALFLRRARPSSRRAVRSSISAARSFSRAFSTESLGVSPMLNHPYND
jgi:hypothetical protein